MGSNRTVNQALVFSAIVLATARGGQVPAVEKSCVISLALDEMQDSTRNVISMEMW